MYVVIVGGEIEVVVEKIEVVGVEEIETVVVEIEVAVIVLVELIRISSRGIRGSIRRDISSSSWTNRSNSSRKIDVLSLPS